MYKYLAESIAVFALTLGVLISLHSNGIVPTPYVAATTVALFVYTIGGISGAHINPAISVALWLYRKLPTDELIKYILAQLVGAVVGLSVSMFLTTNTLDIQANSSLHTWLGEIIGTAFLGWGVSAIVFGQIKNELSGLTIGGFLLLGILVASAGSNGVLNPAVAVGIKSLSLAYFFGPIIGASLGMGLYKMLSK